ncbi:MAG: LptA/OstA family protein [Thermodesulfobacteriota bacterium]
MITRILRRGWAGVLCLLLLGAGLAPTAAGAQSQKKPPKDIPLHISAARLEADQKERVITFSGQVKADYGDNILYAERLRVYYEPPDAGAKPKDPEKKETSPLGDLGGEKINRIVASGGVRFVQADRVATGKEATYYRAKEEVVLTGNPQVWRGENTLKGERIVFNLRTNRVTVESSPKKRVEAHLYTSGQKAPGGGKSFLPGAKSRKAR